MCIGDCSLETERDCVPSSTSVCSTRSAWAYSSLLQYAAHSNGDACPCIQHCYAIANEYSLNAMKRFALFPGPKCFELIESIHLQLIAIRIIVTFRERPHFNIDCVSCVRAACVCVHVCDERRLARSFNATGRLLLFYLRKIFNLKLSEGVVVSHVFNVSEIN